jgi:hypothetical protein
MMASGLRRVVRQTVRFLGEVYTSPELARLHGKEVLVEHNAEDVRGQWASLVVSDPDTGDRICVAELARMAPVGGAA